MRNLYQGKSKKTATKLTESFPDAGFFPPASSLNSSTTFLERGGGGGGGGDGRVMGGRLAFSF